MVRFMPKTKKVEETKEVKKPTKTVDKKKIDKKTSTKTVDKKKPKVSKKVELKKEKKSFRDKIMTFFVGLKKEFTRIHFPNKKDMLKYSGATIVFLVFFAGFFLLINLLWIFVEGLM